MIVNFKKSIFIIVIFIGYYFIYAEYEKLVNFNFKYPNYKVSESTSINIGKSKVNEINKNLSENNNTTNNQIKIENKKEDLKKIQIILSQGDTLLSILKKFEIPENKIFQIINEIENFYDLRKLKVGSRIMFYENAINTIVKIEFDLDIDKLLVIDIAEDIKAEKQNLEKISYELSREYVIFQSLYSDGIKNNLPKEILIKLIKLFSFDLDFQRDIRKNTIISVSYEYNQIKETSNIEYGDINYALISINGKKLEYFKFLTDEGFIDYFNRSGKNVKKSILKTPLDGARLSSNFGMRKHPISGYNKMHKGVDFAAPTGTPIYAGGNGVIEFAGKNGGYGNYIRIRHNNEYKTAYAHLSRFKKGISKGVRVNQGEVIGYVGNTGNSTGPHLHYEILFQNKQINPLKLNLPSGKILEGEELERFTKEYKKIYANHLNLLYE